MKEPKPLHIAAAGNSDLAFFIEAIVLLLMATGTVFVFSAGANVSTSLDLRQFYNFTTLKKILFFPLAVALMYIISRINYRRLGFSDTPAWKSLTPYLLFIGIALLVAVLIFGEGIGSDKRFARRWLRIAIGPVNLSFQPSELAKWATVFFLAGFAAKFRNNKSLHWKHLMIACAITGVVVGLIVTQDFGTAAFIAVLAFVMLFIAGAKWRHLLTPLIVAIPVFYIAVVTSPTRINRIKNFINAENMLYQAKQSLIAISTGGMWGKGLGKGVIKYGHLPEDTSDFIFAVIAEELGFVGAVCVLLLFAGLLVVTMLVIIRCKDRFGRMLAAGIAITITLQAAINIGVVTVVLPTKGIPLPFISAGGTSMLLSAMAAGVLINIARQSGRAQVQIEPVVSEIPLSFPAEGPAEIPPADGEEF